MFKRFFLMKALAVVANSLCHEPLQKPSQQMKNVHAAGRKNRRNR
tara:strand:- start:176 stop:310 length:135 start_codon:yes stop_codon:yes gene_type:complete